MKLISTILLLCIAGTTLSQTLNLQTGYGNAGIVTTNISNDAPHFTDAIGKQSDDKIIMGGSTLIRLLSNGDVDSSFGTNGLAIKADVTEITALAVQADDKIIVAQNEFSQIILKRFTATGQADISFNGTGVIALNEPGNTISISRIRIQADGKILLTGYSYNNEKSRFFIARYLTNGTPDASFNGNGHVTLDMAAGNNEAFDAALQSTGKIIVGGFAQPIVGGIDYLAIIRLNDDGTRDMDFNGTGLIQYNATIATVNALHIYADDKILIAGRSGTQLLLMRFLAEGATDASFGSGGISTAAGLGEAAPKDLIVLNDNKIIIAGQSSVAGGTDWQYAAYKFDADGNADNSFNGTGQTHLIIADNDFCAGAVLQNDGDIILAGYNFSTSIANTARVTSAGIFDLTHGTDGLKTLRVNGTDEIAYSILKQTDGKILTIGTQTDLLARFSRTVVTRYNTDGSIDNSFAGTGIFNYDEPGFVYHSAVLQSDGKIILLGDKAGESPDFITSFCITRLNSNGTIDNGFGTSGKTILPSSETSGYGKGISLLSDDRIIIAGRDTENSDLIIVYRLQVNGLPDNSFGTSGKLTFNPGFVESGLGSVAVQADNKILLGGYVVSAGNQSGFYCARLQENGAIDNSFGNNGIYRTATSTADFLELNSVTLTHNDKILLCGHVSNPSDLSSSVKLIRLLPNGSVDNSFNGTGTGTYYKNLSHDSTFVIPNAVAVHPDSSIYVVGASVNNSGSSSQFLIRIKQNGILDSTLSTEGSGWYYSNQGGLNAVLNDITINTDSIIFVAGSRQAIGTNEDLLVAAYKRLPDVAGITYVFNGDGLWTEATNWESGLVPPTNLPNGAIIIVSPVANGTAILNVQQNIEAGGKIIVNNNASLQMEGNLKIGN